MILTQKDEGARDSLTLTILTCILILNLVACCPRGQATPTALTPPGTVPESVAVTLPLEGSLAVSEAEISGLAWYGDILILLPQYPGRFDNHLYALSKATILSFLDDQTEAPLQPFPIPLDAPILEQIAGYQGVEAIVFAGERVFVTIEAENTQETGMMGYVIAGTVAPDLSQIQLDGDTLTPIPPQADLDNYTDETLLVVEDSVMTLYEANGDNVNPDPVVHRFRLDLTPLDPIPFPNVEYRITDATAPDDSGLFWAINYLYPGDTEKLDPIPDPLNSIYGAGSTHAENTTVERVVAFLVQEDRITRPDVPPIQLELLGDEASRNWEGIVQLDDRGFLLATDKYPETLLAFVAGSVTPSAQD